MRATRQKCSHPPPNTTHRPRTIHQLPSSGGFPPGYQMMNLCEAGDRFGHHAYGCGVLEHLAMRLNTTGL